MFATLAVFAILVEAGISKPMVCPYGLHVGCLSRKRWQPRKQRNDEDNSGSLKIGVIETMLLANGHFAWVTFAILVIFVDFRV